jgi:hypothetical protein
MLALLKEVVGAIAVAKVIILPRLSRSEPTSNHVLIDVTVPGTGDSLPADAVCLLDVPARSTPGET